MTVDRAFIAEAVVGLDRWFDSMRVEYPTPGYGGPVVHWWNHCLAYQGAGLDWRYEGIIVGYVTLWQRTGDQGWFDKACRAGDDLVNGQRSDGRFANSQFELNPGTGGTPHEAAADVGLLVLARASRSLNDSKAERFLACARRNFDQFLIAQLWHEASNELWDSPGTPSFVPNKAATFVEAVLLMAKLTADSSLISTYAIPTADHILAMQMDRPGDLLDGAIAQNRFSTRIVPSYFPLYIARCIPALVQMTAETGDPRFAAAARKAAAFVVRVREADGGLPQVLYPDGRQNRNPRWIAGAGDVVRALDLAAATGIEFDSGPTIDWILRGVRPDGHVATAQGFGRIVPILSRRDQFADELGVVGWADKAFRALAPYVDLDLRPPDSPTTARRATKSDFHWMIR